MQRVTQQSTPQSTALATLQQELEMLREITRLKRLNGIITEAEGGT
jgi:hypothetical protein